MAQKETEQTCFVISPIGAEGSETYTKFKDVLEYVIRPAFEVPGLDLKVVRADEIAGPGSFIKDIVLRLANSYLVIADLTDQNPNVFYELGVRHALSPRTILIAQDTKYIPSDLREYRTIVYDSSARGAATFKSRLHSYLSEIRAIPNKPDNPVLDRLPGADSRTQALERTIADLEGKLRKADAEVVNLSEELLRLRASKSNRTTTSDAKRSTTTNAKITRIPDSRINRLLRLLNWREPSVDPIFWQAEGGLHSMDSSRGPFDLFYPAHLADDDDDYLSEPPTKLMYLANVTTPDWQELLAEIRVITSSDTERILTLFVVVCPDVMGEISQLKSAFDKVISYLDDELRRNFTFDIWDEVRLGELEQEQGLKVL